MRDLIITHPQISDQQKLRYETLNVYYMYSTSASLAKPP
jgi:hypothetical protein